MSEEDVQAFCKDENLRKALVATDNLYITGELGEGRHNRVFSKNWELSADEAKLPHVYPNCISTDVDFCGVGAFGRVFKGLLVTEDPEEPSGRRVSLIAIKTVKSKYKVAWQFNGE